MVRSLLWTASDESLQPDEVGRIQWSAKASTEAPMYLEVAVRRVRYLPKIMTKFWLSHLAKALVVLRFGLHPNGA